jgi:hypothetical protein
MGRIGIFLIVFLFHGCVLGQEAVKCKGRFRWDVKTLTDTAGSEVPGLKVEDATVEELVNEKPPVRLCILSGKDSHLPRQKDEYRLVRIDAVVVDYNIQRDRDYHILVESPDRKFGMVVEIPDPDCQLFEYNPRLKGIYTRARQEFGLVIERLENNKEPVPVQITGVPFWDARHWWLRGTAPNGREIHPVISVTFSSDTTHRGNTIP